MNACVDAPASRAALAAKFRGERLSSGAISAIVRDIAARRYSQQEVAGFVRACAAAISPEEVLDLTHAMAQAGTRLVWSRHGPVVDIHSVGGLPGNRISMLVVPIIAASGLMIPKTASRAITSPAGTADTMEVLAKVELTRDEIETVVAAQNGCLVAGGRAGLSPADDVLNAAERMIDFDAPGPAVASILSKKLAAGVTHLVVDIPVGPAMKVKTGDDAAQLRALFQFVTAHSGMMLDCVVTDGTTPLGRGIGPALEARDVMQVLRCERDAPQDLRDRALAMAARLLALARAGRLSIGEGFAQARQLLESGAALIKMEHIVAAQGEPPARVAPGAFVAEIAACHSGAVTAIDCHRITKLAVAAGAPEEKGAGLDLLRKPGDPVLAGEALFRIHACDGIALARAQEAAVADNGYRVG